MISDELQRTSRLSDAHRVALLDRLDQMDAKFGKKNRRATNRLKFRKTDVSIHITQPGGGTTDCVVSTRDLSATGVSFLYAGFLHAGTRIEICLKKRAEPVAGTVTWCRHIFGVHHLVGLKFKSRIFVKLYADPADWGDPENETPINSAELHGNLLLIDDQEIDRLLFTHHVRETKIAVTDVATTADALSALKATKFDLVVCDLNLGEMSGEQAMLALRNAGYRGTILALTAETSPDRLRSATDAGASAILCKPYDPNKLLNSIGHWLGTGTLANPEDMITSELAGQPGTEKMLPQYIEQVNQLLTVLRTQIDDNNLDMVRRVCQTLKGTGRGYGFPMLSDIATNVVQVLDQSKSISESAIELKQLESICRRLSATKPKENSSPVTENRQT